MMWRPETPVRAATFCALDFETTGLLPALHRVVETGAVRFRRGEGTRELSFLSHPGGPIPPEATAIHGIGDADVADTPSFEDRLAELLTFVEDSILVIHNSSFDLSFIAAALDRTGARMPSLWAIDTVALARRAWPGLRGYGLAALCRHFSLPLDHHRALGDARAAAALFLKALDDADPEGGWRLADLKRFIGRFNRLERPAPPAESVEGPLGDLTVGIDTVIRYRDMSGSVTTRTIRPREFFRQGGRLYVLAYCHLRGDIRCFSTDRIER